ncbi:hypothetical protein GW17_00055689, partial [Ensete ventricosum]
MLRPGVTQEWVDEVPWKGLDYTISIIEAAGELDYFSAHIRLRELGKLEDKA